MNHKQTTLCIIIQLNSFHNFLVFIISFHYLFAIIYTIYLLYRTPRKWSYWYYWLWHGSLISYGWFIGFPIGTQMKWKTGKKDSITLSFSFPLSISSWKSQLSLWLASHKRITFADKCNRCKISERMQLEEVDNET